MNKTKLNFYGWIVWRENYFFDILCFPNIAQHKCNIWNRLKLERGVLNKFLFSSIQF